MPSQKEVPLFYNHNYIQKWRRKGGKYWTSTNFNEYYAYIKYI